MDLNEVVARACVDVPGLVRASLLLVSAGIFLGGVGEGSSLDHEPLVRSAMCCFGSQAIALGREGAPAAFLEYIFVSGEQLVVLECARGDRRLALAVECTRAANLALVVTSARDAMQRVESGVDLAALWA